MDATTELRTQLKAIGSVDMVELALERRGIVKLVALELRERAPDDAATRLVITSYRAGRAPPWVAALLLGSVRGPDGYVVAREILISAPGMLAEGYAGSAMARILGPTSRPDLVAIMRGDWPKKVCEGAAQGLAELHDSGVVEDVLVARREHKISASCAGTVVAAVPDAASLITAWLAGGDDCREDVAMEAAVSLSGRPKGLADRRLAQAVCDSLDARRVKVSPQVRRMLGERAATAPGS